MSESKSRQDTSSPSGEDNPSENPRTLPSIDIADIRATAKRLDRKGTVRLGPEEEENTSELENPESAALFAAGKPVPGESIERGHLLGREARPPEHPPSPSPAEGTLGRLVRSLKDVSFDSAPPPYMPAADPDPFEGMMGATLELKIDPSFFGLDAENSAGNRERDLRWLHPPRSDHPRLPNSFGLSDRAVSRACLELYPGLKPPRGDALIAVGLLTRLESWITDLFAEVGREAARVLALEIPADKCSDNTRTILENLRRDPDIQSSLTALRSDDAGGSSPGGEHLTTLRLIGARVLKRQGEALAASRCAEDSAEALSTLARLAARVRDHLEERSRLIQQYFPEESSAFALRFMEQRGLNARPGFVWLRREWEEL